MPRSTGDGGQAQRRRASGPYAARCAPWLGPRPRPAGPRPPARPRPRRPRARGRGGGGLERVPPFTSPPGRGGQAGRGRSGAPGHHSALHPHSARPLPPPTPPRPDPATGRRRRDRPERPRVARLLLRGGGGAGAARGGPRRLLPCQSCCRPAPGPRPPGRSARSARGPGSRPAPPRGRGRVRGAGQGPGGGGEGREGGGGPEWRPGAPPLPFQMDRPLGGPVWKSPWGGAREGRPRPPESQGLTHRAGRWAAPARRTRRRRAT